MDLPKGVSGDKVSYSLHSLKGGSIIGVIKRASGSLDFCSGERSCCGMTLGTCKNKAWVSQALLELGIRVCRLGPRARV